MRVLLQAVKNASVVIDEKTYSSINRGFLLLVGFNNDDNLEIVNKTISKACGLRVFADENGKTNLGLNDIDGEILCVSQFTLYADVKKGKRPSFVNAARGEISEPLYNETIRLIREMGYKCQTGVFGADMKVHLVNDGPMTIIIDSEEL